MSSTSKYQPRRFRLWPILLCATGLLTVGMILGLAPGETHTSLANSFQSFGHLGFFAIVAIVAALAIARLNPLFLRYPVLQYVGGLLSAVLAGGLLEFAQKFIPSRDPSWSDLAFDTIGGVVGISFLIAVDWLRAPSRGGRLIGAIAALIMLVAFVFGAWPFVTCLSAYYDRNNSVPLLLKFDPSWIHRFVWHDDCVDVEPVGIPENWPQDAGRVVAKIVIHADESFPGVGVYEPYPDWRHREFFAFDILNPTSAPLEMGIRIHDFPHDEDYYDRFNRAVTIQPGFQTVRIAISDIEHGPRSRRLDLTQILGVKLFLIRPTETIQLFLGNLRLE